MATVRRLLRFNDLPRGQKKKPFRAGTPQVARLVIYDRILLEKSAEFRKWLKDAPYAVGVDSGETLKSLSSFVQFVENLPPGVATLSRKNMEVWAVGGGSVGDFAGFFASVWKRGVKLVMVPSTWLSALDSAHGGKTGLNLQGAKNQIGTFYPASEVLLIRELLEEQPKERLSDAMGELAKIALIDGAPWTRNLRGWAKRDEFSQMELFWKLNC